MPKHGRILFAITLALTFVVCHALGAQVRVLTAQVEARIRGDFSMIGALAVSTSGQVLVTQPQEHTVRLFDQNGKEIRQFGRSGEGPGEFVRMGRAGVWAGGYWVNDPMAFRITLVSNTLELVRTIPLQAGTLGPAARIEALSDGGNLLLSVTDRGAGDRPENGKRFFAVFAQTGVEKPLGGFASSPECLVTSGNWSTKVPFCERQFADVSNNGSRLVLLTLDSPRASAYRVTVVRASGDTVYSQSYPYQAELISKHFADSTTNAIARGSPPALATIYRSEITLPQTFPPVKRVVVGDDGSVWLEEHSLGRGHRWLLLDALGRVAGRVAFPNGFKLVVGKRDRVWGLESDADDLQTIVRYRLQ